jgi:hypothetical protein
MLSVGEGASVSLGRVFGDTETEWVGEAVCRDLLMELQPLNTPQLPPQPRTVTVEPKWSDRTLPKEGLPVALMLSVSRTPCPTPPDVKPEGRWAPRYLGVLSLLMAAPRLGRTLSRLPTALSMTSYDVMVSYRETETGLKGSNFAFRLQETLESAGYSVFCYAAAISTGERWMSPFTNGVQSCRVFMPVLSPTYGCMDVAPWSAAELLQAARVRNASPLHEPHIVPIWHHGEELHPDTESVLSAVPGLVCIPDRNAERALPARRMKQVDVSRLVLARLRALLRPGRHASAGPSQDTCAHCGH